MMDVFVAWVFFRFLKIFTGVGRGRRDKEK
jgi:hypothetical protein